MSGQAISEGKISLPSVLSIRDIADVYAQIRISLNNHERVVLDLPAQASIDLSFLQLVEAARKQADLSGKSFSLARPVDDSVKAVLERAGFLPFDRAEDTRFWFHKETLQ